MIFNDLSSRFIRNVIVVFGTVFPVFTGALHAQDSPAGFSQAESHQARDYEPMDYQSEFQQITLALDQNKPSSEITVNLRNGVASKGNLLFRREFALVLQVPLDSGERYPFRVSVIPITAVQEIKIPGRYSHVTGAGVGFIAGCVVSFISGATKFRDRNESEDLGEYLLSVSMFSSWPAFFSTVLCTSAGAAVGSIFNRSERIVTDFSEDDKEALDAMAVYPKSEPSCLKGFR